MAFHAAETALRALWERQKTNPTLPLKRQLWAQLLKIVYGHDIESDALWLQHTYLVVVAKCIAFAVLGLNEDDPGDFFLGRLWRTQASTARSRATFSTGSSLIRKARNLSGVLWPMSDASALAKSRVT